MDKKTIIGESRICEMQNQLGTKAWPEFMQHDEIVSSHWSLLYTDFLSFQYALVDGLSPIGVGNTIALNWDGSWNELPAGGLDWAMVKSKQDLDKGLKPNLMIAVQILIKPDQRSKGISYEMLNIMKGIAKSHGLNYIALPVRPTLKYKFPLIPITEYVKWTNEEGLPFDPWLRVHHRAGGKITGICEQSMHIRGTIVEWELWTALEFPGSGDYIVDKALVPIQVNKELDEGTYLEPNVWIIHEAE